MTSEPGAEEVHVDWKTFWDEFARRFPEREFGRQVGRTDRGVPISEEETGLIVGEAVTRLRLDGTDRLLDLCCGNGYLTVGLAEIAGEVVGVDFSEVMLSRARRFNSAENLKYRCGSALELHDTLEGDGTPFDKACMLESLHYFVPDQLVPLLTGLCAHTGDDVLFYFSGVPDVDRKHRFLDTPERRREYERRKKEGSDGMGYWWSRTEIETGAKEVGLECDFLAQSPELSTAYYRFDVVLTRG